MAIVRVFGKLLMSLGVGVLLFVAWVIWGTNFQTAQAQDRLAKEFDNIESVDVRGSRAGRPPKGFSPEPGEPVFRLSIPEIDLNDGKGYIVVEGVDEETLKLGPGHYPRCGPGFEIPLCTRFPAAWPGTPGRVVLSGHRTTYKAPFFDLDKLEDGDEIIAETKWGTFTYEVYDQRIVDPTDASVVVEKKNVRELVLTTCNPKFSASQRLITYARQVDEA